MNFNETKFLRQLVEKHRRDALEFPPLTQDEPAEYRQREQNEPRPGPLKTRQTDEHQFQAEHRPENDFGLQRPKSSQTAADQLPILGMILRDGGQQEMTPMATVNFHIVLAPAHVGF